MLEIGIYVPILLTTTKVNDEYLINFEISKRTGSVKNILFLARIEVYKGIYEALKTYEILTSFKSDLQLTIVGSGSELSNVQKYVKRNNLKNVKIKGVKIGNELIDEFLSADLYLFPSYAEGMPTSVLEAMAFGLPIVSSSVGGLNDFFENGKMGYLIPNCEPDNYVSAINKLIDDPVMTETISNYNHNYAIKHFLASNVANRIESDINDNCNKTI